MGKPRLSVSFSLIMKTWLFFLFSFFITVKVFAQEKTIEGIVFDKDTRERIAKTNILNSTTGKSFYNDLKGEFKIDAQTGDVLVFNKQDYYPDTIKIKSGANLAVYLRRTAIPLHEVTIRDSLYNPQKRLAATKREYSKAYGPSAYNDLLSTSPGSGAGISIDAIYNSFSRSGRNARHLQQEIQGDYRQNVIDYRFNKTFVGNVTGLKDRDLINFMFRYRPGYYMVTTASEYEFIVYIRNNLKRYLRSKKTNNLPPLIQAK